jgi:hypothetical protein
MSNFWRGHFRFLSRHGDGLALSLTKKKTTSLLLHGFRGSRICANASRQNDKDPMTKNH